MSLLPLTRKKNVVVYPMSSGKMINVGAFHAHEELAGTSWSGPWVQNVDKEELLEVHSHWEPEVRAILDVGHFFSLDLCQKLHNILLQCVERPSRWAIHSSRALKTWVSGNVVLLGDAVGTSNPLIILFHV
jgi:salicylate hydroxylase